MKKEKKYRIGQVAQAYGVGPDSLRYYEKLGILKPQRDTNNYRLYSTRDIYTLNILRELRSLGFSMADIQAHLVDFDVDGTLALFEEEIRLIEEKQRDLDQLRQALLARKEGLEAKRSLVLPTQPQVRELAERNILRLSQAVYQDEELDFVMKNIENSVEELYLIGRGEIGASLPLEQISSGHYGIFSSVFFLTQAETYQAKIPGGAYLVQGVYGSYDQLPGTWAQMFEALEAQGLEAAGDPLELYIIDNHTSSRPEEYITELQIPLVAKEA